jgi:hypothetical protein
MNFLKSLFKLLVILQLNQLFGNNLNNEINYNFIVAGHLYGAAENKNIIYPQTTLLANVDFINKLNPDFFISLGDNVANGNDKDQVDRFKEIFLTNIKIPFFTAYGNHDGDRSLWKSNADKTYYSLRRNTELFIFLDSELNQKLIDNEMFDFIKKELSTAFKNRINNIFILSHKLIWATNKDNLQIVIKNSNERSSKNYNKYKKFMSNIDIVLKSKPSNVKIFWISGDVGQYYSSPLFFMEDKVKNITYIATGIGDTNDDLILEFKVNNGLVNFKAHSLITNKSVDIKKHNLEYWKDKYTIYNYIKSRLFIHSRFKYFILGFTFGLCIPILLIFWRIVFSSK